MADFFPFQILQKYKHLSQIAMLDINNIFGIDRYKTFPSIPKFKNANQENVRESFYLKC